ncbi:MAG: hypothetical protein HYY02_12350 [Chloroflexi bacterium]|nr:hypothetical protein [Chloroflexota bacterium]
MTATGLYPPSSSLDGPPLDPELAVLIRRLKGAYTPARLSAAFQQVLGERLVAEARRLQAEPAASARAPLLRRAMVGAAALSVAGVALVVLKSRLLSDLLSQEQLPASQGG